MTQNKTLLVFAFACACACAGLLGACTPMVPTELANARRAYQEASAGPAAQWTPAELHKAHEALAQAETAFGNDPESYHTRDLAYVAERKSQMAQALASIAKDTASGLRATDRFSPTPAPPKPRAATMSWPSTANRPADGSTTRPFSTFSVPTNEATNRVRG